MRTAGLALQASSAPRVVFMSVGFLIPVFLDPSSRISSAAQPAARHRAASSSSASPSRDFLGRRNTATLRWIAEDREPDRARSAGARSTWRSTTRRSRPRPGWVAPCCSSSSTASHYDSGFAAWASGRRSGLEARRTSALYFLVSERALRPVTAIVLAERQPSGMHRPGRAPPAARSPGRSGPGLRCWACSAVGVVGGLAEVRRGHRVRRGGDASSSACVAFAAGLLRHACYAAKAHLRPAALDAPVRSSGSRRASSTSTCRSTTPARSACSRPASTGWPTACGSASASATSSAARWARRWRARRFATAPRLGGEEREIGALFVDLVGSTSMALAMPPSEVVRLLNQLLPRRGRRGRVRGRVREQVRGRRRALRVRRARRRATTPPATRSAPPGCWPSASSARCPRSASASASRRARRWPGTSAPSSASSTR